jgi:pyruvate kinase
VSTDERKKVMNDGRFDRVNAQRQEDAAKRKAKRELIAKLEQAQTVEDLKPIIERLIHRSA